MHSTLHVHSCNILCSSNYYVHESLCACVCIRCVQHCVVSCIPVEPCSPQPAAVESHLCTCPVAPAGAQEEV